MQYEFKEIDLDPEFKAFFKALQSWIENDFPFINEWEFDISYGICGNACTPFGDYRNYLDILFQENNLDITFPFNQSIISYSAEDHYQNPMRLAFIRFYAKD